MKVGQKVYIPKLLQYGEVVSVDPNTGLVTEVKIFRASRRKDAKGVAIPIETIIQVGNMVVVAVGWIKRIILDIQDLRYRMREKKLQKKLSKSKNI